jgi:hypothetical protein
MEPRLREESVMRIAAALIALCLSGCGGYVMVEGRSEDTVPVPPRTEPAYHTDCPGVCAQEAIEIALNEAVHRDCTELTVEQVECGEHTCKVELRGEVERGRDAHINVRVDRRTGEVVSYKCKVHKKHGHHEDDDD